MAPEDTPNYKVAHSLCPFLLVKFTVIRFLPFVHVEDAMSCFFSEAVFSRKVINSSANQRSHFHHGVSSSPLSLSSRLMFSFSRFSSSSSFPVYVSLSSLCLSYVLYLFVFSVCATCVCVCAIVFILLELFHWSSIESEHTLKCANISSTGGHCLHLRQQTWMQYTRHTVVLSCSFFVAAFVYCFKAVLFLYAWPPHSSLSIVCSTLFTSLYFICPISQPQCAILYLHGLHSCFLLVPFLRIHCTESLYFIINLSISISLRFV